MSKLYQILADLKEYEWVNLSHTVTPEIPHFPIFDPIEEETLATVADGGFLAKKYTLGSQYGTHIDAPIHFVEDRAYLNDIPLKDLVLPLYVIHKEEEATSNADYAITAQDIQDYEAIHGEIPNGAFVALSTGWSEKFLDPDAFFNLDEEGLDHAPGWTIDALKYLDQVRQVKAIGHETLNTDSSLDYRDQGDLVAERYWLGLNKFQVEVLCHLRQLPSTGSLISIGFPRIDQCPGFNAQVYAIVDPEA
ncbi:cyclase family protein [Hutsoniella sourekii]|uniref:cyclase family protein n=1 Tax=Hutsoniella sourekii TaxID=87650 RepID=UPI00047F8803|nr:cyclase family protein [Hutsoniella sourekii]